MFYFKSCFCPFLVSFTLFTDVLCWSLNNDLDYDVVRELLQRTRIRNKVYRQVLDRDEDMRNFEVWTGRWFPDEPKKSVGESIEQQKLEHKTETMWTMINSTCDDGKTNLTVDWQNSPVNYTCFDPKHRLEPDADLSPLIIKDTIPQFYHARHLCMNKEIVYDSYLPTFGPHRPAWPRYGEYVFVPKQRWIHSLEHGAVVMLYHPCAHPFLISRLKEIVRSCLYRHIITPYTLLPLDRPLAVLTWGWALLMSDIDSDIVTKFIKDHALQGPEHTNHNGQYDHMLIKPAKLITSVEDSMICPYSQA